MRINVIRLLGTIKGKVHMLDFNAKECPPDFIIWYANAVGMTVTDWFGYTNGLDWVGLNGREDVPINVGTIRPYCVPHERGLVPKESYTAFCRKRAKKGRK
jgi:hypothetical protein